VTLSEVTRLVAAANEGRRAGAEDSEVERQLDALFRISETLAVYGSLAPGQANHHIVAPLGGEWTGGVVEGELLPAGWGTGLGYLGFRPLAGGGTIAVQVLTAAALTTAWPMLDEFEGPEYQRILVPVFSVDGERRLQAVANLYAAAEAPRRA
jgi:gamma-glutamylcyclotransferase (GGCT)/AIG2-like uncharacterized protein YtfP